VALEVDATWTGAIPRTCRELWETNYVARANGLYSIDVDDSASLAPFNAYCSDVSSTGKKLTYLELASTWLKSGGDTVNPNSGALVNFGVIKSDIGCNWLRTFYERLLLRKIDTSGRLYVQSGFTGNIPEDRTFTTTFGSPITHSNGQSTFSAFAATSSCDGSQTPANINLTGTPFFISNDNVFQASGWAASGSATITSDHKGATLLGGGSCGELSVVGNLLALQLTPP